MGRIVGIDLGTTYSAIAIPEAHAGEGFSSIPECPGYSIILDPLKNRVTPSVVAEDDQGEIVVGHKAKNRAGWSPEPIMFSKRYMGEANTYTLNKQGILGAKEVATHILRYLKKIAEARLGEPVTDAVITVPAYFPLRAKQMTEDAAKNAGLSVAQIAQEPVAAALMYFQRETRDPLRIMTYDLGGGTFDVAIVEKRDGVISSDSIKAFAGDRFLGGYNFDVMLADWITEQLIGRGYDLRLDGQDPADKVIRAKIMIYAERAKIALSKEQFYEIQEPNTGIEDHSGNPVAIEGLTILRGEFEQMIAESIESTLALCRSALYEKAKLKSEDIDEIIMVGGCSQIPLVSERLEAEFGRRPRLIEPALCVALGAAILAGTKGQTHGRLKLDAVPTETYLPVLAITGRILSADGLAGAEGYNVELRSLDGAVHLKKTTAVEGRFAFETVSLAPESMSEFVLRAKSASGDEVASHRFSVIHSQAARGAGIVEAVTNVLSKPIAIDTVGGLVVVAPERTPLPNEVSRQAWTSDTSGEIRIPIVEGSNPMGEIVMKDIPPSLPVGSAIEITLTLQENYQIRGRAYVPALGRDVSVIIDIPIPPQKTLDELRRDYEEVAEKVSETLDTATPGNIFGKRKQIESSMKAVEEMLRARNAEPARIQEAIDELDNLAREIGRGWQPEPPRAVVDHKLKEAEELLAEVIAAKPKLADDGYDRRLAALRNEALKAYDVQNGSAWTEAFEKVVKLCDDLYRLVPNKQQGGKEPDPAVLLVQLGQELGQLGEWAKKQKLFARFENDFGTLAQSLQKIDPKAPDAMAQIRDWYLTGFADLKKRLESPEAIGKVTMPHKK